MQDRWGRRPPRAPRRATNQGSTHARARCILLERSSPDSSSMIKKCSSYAGVFSVPFPQSPSSCRVQPRRSRRAALPNPSRLRPTPCSLCGHGANTKKGLRVPCLAHPLGSILYDAIAGRRARAFGAKCASMGRGSHGYDWARWRALASASSGAASDIAHMHQKRGG
eukprot:scaffold53231_cov30-Tisochrysis_lutea.AAC.2